MRVALPIWKGNVSPVLDTASRLLVVQVEPRNTRNRLEIELEPAALPDKLSRIRALGIDLLICGAVSRSFSSMIGAVGIRLRKGIAGPVDEVIDALFDGKLDDPRFRMPGFSRTADAPDGETPILNRTRDTPS